VTTAATPAEEESYTCDTCSTVVGADRVLVLGSSGQLARHPDCHEFGKAMH
jgi:hypothetical protein